MWLLRLPLVEEMWMHWGQCQPLLDLATLTWAIGSLSFLEPRGCSSYLGWVNVRMKVNQGQSSSYPLPRRRCIMIALAAAELALFWPRNCIRPEVTRSITGSRDAEKCQMR